MEDINKMFVEDNCEVCGTKGKEQKGKCQNCGWPLPNAIVTKAALTRLLVEAQINALHQLAIDRINHTLSTHPKEWTREIDFINERIATLQTQLTNMESKE